MATWTNDEINKIDIAEELRISSLRNDGSLRNPVTIWVVRVDDDLYVRSVNGRTSAWFRGIQIQHEGQIRAGGVERDVTFVKETDPEINRKIDAAYAAKFDRYAANIINRINGSEARAATIKLIPRNG